MRSWKRHVSEFFEFKLIRKRLMKIWTRNNKIWKILLVI